MTCEHKIVEVELDHAKAEAGWIHRVLERCRNCGLEFEGEWEPCECGACSCRERCRC